MSKNIAKRFTEIKEFYETGEIVEVLIELDELGVDLDSLSNELTIHDLVKMLNRLLDV